MAITYPVDIENTSWSLYQISTASIVQTGRSYPRSDGAEVIEPDYKFLLEVTENRPSIDYSTQKVIKTTTIDLDEGTVTTGWDVVALTQEEIESLLPPYFTTSTGIKLDVSEDAQNAFSRLLVMINSTNMVDTDPISIKDVYGTSHGLTVGDLRSTLNEYGLHCYSLFTG